MTQQIIQQLAVHLKSGRTVVVPFNAEKADVLNPQMNCPHFARQIFDQSGVQACRTTASLYCLGER